jgi:beta-barrel assembly-enhancing protease
MKYTPKTIPEGINTSTEHPLREFALLTSGVIAAVLLLILVASLLSDYLVRFIPVEKENEWLSGHVMRQSDDDEPVSPERQALEAYLQTLVVQLGDDEHRNYIFTTRVIEEPTPNAFVMPGGHIFVTSGLLSMVSSENALAMVLGHEMAHQYHRDPIRSLGRGIVIVLALVAISGAEAGDLVQSFIANAANIGQLAYSREQEADADETGVELVMRHYGHAQDVSEFFRALDDSRVYDSHTPFFLRTHPGTAKRIEFLRRYEMQRQGPLQPLPGVVGNYLAAHPGGTVN